MILEEFISYNESVDSPRKRIAAVYRGSASPKLSPALGIYSRYLPRGEFERKARTAGMGIIEYVPLTTQLGPPWHMIDGYMSYVEDTKITNEYYYDKHSKSYRQIRKYLTDNGSITEDIGNSVGAGSEHIGKYYITDPEDYSVLSRIIEKTQIESNERKFKSAVSRLGDDGIVLGRVDRTPYQKIMIEFAGAEQFLLDLYSEEGELIKLVTLLSERWKEEFRLAAQSEAEFIWLPDNVTSLLTPPDMFKKYHLPLYQYASEIAHNAGKKIIAHFDGAIKTLIPMIMESGIDVIESVSDPMIGGDVGLTDGEIYRLLPGKTIIPNFPSNLADKGDNEILQYITSLANASDGQLRMLQISEDLPDGYTEQTVEGILKAWKSLRWM